jgi:hypothetical protein
MITIPHHPDYRKNQDKAGDLLPCVICGRGIKSENPKMVHVHNGGTSIVTEEEAKTLDPAADMYFFPIGPCCLRKHPEIKPYAHKAIPADYVPPEKRFP